jgi:hypothetical protein
MLDNAPVKFWAEYGKENMFQPAVNGIVVDAEMLPARVKVEFCVINSQYPTPSVKLFNVSKSADALVS